MFIGYSRYKLVSNPLSGNTNSERNSIISIGLSLACGAFWSIAPLLGWSHYSLEGVLISCSVEWSERTPSVLSYNIVITILVYIVPLCVFIFTSAKIFYIVSLWFKLSTYFKIKFIQDESIKRKICLFTQLH